MAKKVTKKKAAKKVAKKEDPEMESFDWANKKQFKSPGDPGLDPLLEACHIADQDCLSCGS